MSKFGCAQPGYINIFLEGQYEPELISVAEYKRNNSIRIGGSYHGCRIINVVRLACGG